MISIEDLADIMFEEIKYWCCSKKQIPGSRTDTLSGKRGFFVKEPYLKSYSQLVTKRKFFSEWEIKSLLKNNEKILTIPKNSILSPLALDWLEEKGIKIVYA